MLFCSNLYGAYKSKNRNFCADAFRDDGKPSKEYIKWFRKSQEPPVIKDGEHVSTAQDYGEKLSGRPPDNNPDQVIYSNNNDDKKEADGDPESAEDSQLMYAVLTDENGMSRLDDDGQPITTRSIAPDDLLERTVPQPQPDGTICRGRIVKEVENMETTIFSLC